MANAKAITATGMICPRHVSTKKHVEVAKLKTENECLGVFQTDCELRLGSYM